MELQVGKMDIGVAKLLDIMQYRKAAHVHNHTCPNMSMKSGDARLGCKFSSLTPPHSKSMDSDAADAS